MNTTTSKGRTTNFALLLEQQTGSVFNAKLTNKQTFPSFPQKVLITAWTNHMEEEGQVICLTLQWGVSEAYHSN